jgi:hypothetical protein
VGGEVVPTGTVRIHPPGSDGRAGGGTPDLDDFGADERRAGSRRQRGEHVVGRRAGTHLQDQGAIRIAGLVDLNPTVPAVVPDAGDVHDPAFGSVSDLAFVECREPAI